VILAMSTICLFGGDRFSSILPGRYPRNLDIPGHKMVKTRTYVRCPSNSVEAVTLSEHQLDYHDLIVALCGQAASLRTKLGGVRIL